MWVVAVHAKLKEQLEELQWQPDKDEEFEDSEGHVLSRKVRRPGLCGNTACWCAHCWCACVCARVVGSAGIHGHEATRHLVESIPKTLTSCSPVFKNTC